MPANNILDQNNAQYVKGHQTSKDMVNACIPVNAEFSVVTGHWTLKQIYMELQSGYHRINNSYRILWSSFLTGLTHT